MKKQIFLWLCIPFIHLAMLSAQNPGWEINTAQYEYSMTATSVVYIDDVPVDNPEDLLAAFAGDEIRGIAEAVYDEDADRYLYFLSIFSNEFMDEDISFKFYNASNDEVIELWNTIQFENGFNLGSLSNPYNFFAAEPQMCTLTFHINNIHGQPIENAQVSIDTQTYEAGEYIIENLFPNTYNWTVSKEGYLTESGQITIDFGDTEREIFVSMDLDIENEPGTFKVEFALYDTNNNQINDVQIVFNGETHQGQLTFYNLNPGSYPYQISKEGYDTKEGQVTIVASDVYIELVLLNSTLNPQLHSEKNIEIYPNPAHDYIKITNYTGLNIINTKIIDLMGKTQIDMPWNTHKHRIDVSSIKKGIYLVQITFENNQTQSLKIQKK